MTISAIMWIKDTTLIQMAQYFRGLGFDPLKTPIINNQIVHNGVFEYCNCSAKNT